MRREPQEDKTMKAIIRKDEQAVSPVIATILMVAITVVLAAVLYVMVSGLLGGQTANRPVLTFSGESRVSGNATFSVASVSQPFPSSSYKVNLQVGTSFATTPVTLPTSGSFTPIVVGGVTYRIYWTDLGGEGNLNDGDSFRVAGANIPLAPTGNYVFYLLWAADNAQIQTQDWLV